MERPFSFQQNPTASAADDVVVGTNGSVIAVAAGDVIQLPQVCSQELTFALFSVWGAAPKITQLIGTTAAPAAARPAEVEGTPGTCTDNTLAALLIQSCLQNCEDLLSALSAGGFGLVEVFCLSVRSSTCVSTSNFHVAIAASAEHKVALYLCGK